MKIIVLLALSFIGQNCFAQPGIQDSLLLYLPFNGNANDESGNNNHGTVMNAALTLDRLGNANSAYNFNGTNSYIQIAASPSLAKIYATNEITISAWINIRNWYQGWNVFAILEQYNPITDFGATLVEANWASGGILFFAGYNGNYMECNYTWNFNAWHHITVTYSVGLGKANFYVDGVLVCSKAYTQNFTPDYTNAYVIGRSLSGPDEYSDGIIDELRIYNRVLSINEVSILPLRLLSFNAKNHSGKAVLQWQTTSENNTSHFIIERSPNGIDFEITGNVGSNNRQGINNYSFTDNKNISGLCYYRIKMVDIDGKYTYSPIKKISNEQAMKMEIFPNPTQNLLMISSVHLKGKVRLLSADGKLLLEKTAVPNMQIDMSKYRKGVYMIQYESDHEIGIQKIIKQ